MTSSAPDTGGEDRDERNGEAVRSAVGGASAHDRSFDRRECGSRLRADQSRGAHSPPAKSLDQIPRCGNAPFAVHPPRFGLGKPNCVEGTQQILGRAKAPARGRCIGRFEVAMR